MVKLNVLDYAVIDEGSNAQTAYQETLRLAQYAEQLGYHRFWVAEHHNVPAFASSSPELMMMHLLAHTTQIRLGSGGVMLPHYQPLKVAEQFRTLEALYPGRVDLGIGNNPGTPIVQRAMHTVKREDFDYFGRIADIRAHLSEDMYGRLVANPSVPTVPEMWLLSTSETSAKRAAEQGMGLTLGTFLLPDAESIRDAQQSVTVYREAFQTSNLNMTSSVMIAPFIVIADTEEEAERYAQALDIWLLGKQNFAAFKTFPSCETAQTYTLTEAERQTIRQHRARMLVGMKATVKQQLDEMLVRYDADEVLIVPLVPTIEQRCKTLQLCVEMYR